MRPLLAFVLAFYVSAALAETGDVEWFYQNQTARREQIAACRNDARMGQRLCRNAERAEQRRWEDRQQGSRADFPQSPITRDAIAIACRQPPAQRGLLGTYCPNRRT